MEAQSKLILHDAASLLLSVWWIEFLIWLYCVSPITLLHLVTFIFYWLIIVQKC